MKKRSTIRVIVVALAFSANLHADDFSEHFIAAKAGVVNYLEGRPQVFFGSEGKVAETRGHVRAGDSIKTGPQDRLEILLNPGSYLRLGFNSELRAVETGFDAMHFELVRGSVIVESATFNRKVHALRIGTPAGDVIFDKDGLYRLEAQPAAVYLAVHDGKAKWVKEGTQIATLKSGKRFALAVPAPGDVLELDGRGGRYVVSRVIRSPLPDDTRHCVYLALI